MLLVCLCYISLKKCRLKKNCFIGSFKQTDLDIRTEVNKWGRGAGGGGVNRTQEWELRVDGKGWRR